MFCEFHRNRRRLCDITYVFRIVSDGSLVIYDADISIQYSDLAWIETPNHNIDCWMFLKRYALPVNQREILFGGCIVAFAVSQAASLTQSSWCEHLFLGP